MTEKSSKQTTIKSLVNSIADRFIAQQIFLGHGTDNVYDEALHLILHCLSIDFSNVETSLNQTISEKDIIIINQLVDKRISTRKPLAYLMNKANFAGLEFYVDEHVLVPRSPFAELIEDRFFPWIEPDTINSVLDLCTGSGCIGISTAYALPQAKIIISDVCENALSVARKNVLKHHKEKQITLLQSDVFKQIPDQTFDLIISNPPYVSEEEYQNLPTEYINEPRLGLVSGIDGMNIVTEILLQADAFLSNNGIILIEVGASAEQLMQRFPKIPFQWIEFENGGDGIFLLTKQDLMQYQEEFR